jgi:hypothetical protein
MAMESPPKAPDHIPRWLAGAYGGLAISFAQIIGQSVGPKLADFITHGEWRNAMTLVLTAAFGIAVLMALGSVVAFFEDEQSRRKLFLMGVAAPALFAAAAPSVFTLIEHKVAEVVTISAAYAADKIEKPECNEREKFSIFDGLKLFFGASDEPRYRVIVGSFKTTEGAQSMADKINAQDSSLHALIGRKAPCNDYYAVVVSPYVPLAEAKRVQAKVLKLDSVDDAYLSPYEYR